jgi:hypothetical protein
MTEGISFVIPSKWIFDEDRTMWMVFAGHPGNPFYSFNLIKMRLQLALRRDSNHESTFNIPSLAYSYAVTFLCSHAVLNSLSREIG